MSIFDKIKRFFKRNSQLNTLQIESSEKSTLQNSETVLEKKEEAMEKEIIDEKFLYGYILKTLKSIEDTLKRIEYNMITKEWASLNLSEKKDLAELLQKLEEKIDYLKLTALPASSALSRSSRSNEIVKKAIEIIKNKKEISYEDLARELGISNSYLRAIASLIELNDKEIRRVIKDKRGYFIFVERASEGNSTA